MEVRPALSRAVMEGILQWLAARIGVPVAPGTDLHVEFAGFPSGGLGLLTLVGAALALGVVWFAYVRDAHRLSARRRMVLTGLRGAAVALAILVLLDPQLVAVRRDSQPGQTLVLIDTSQSMAQVDGYRDEGTAADLGAAWRSLGGVDPAASTRLDLARALLENDGHRALRALRTKNRVQVFGFSSGLDRVVSLDVGTGQEQAPAPIDLSPLAATGSYTNVGGAVREALSEVGGGEIAGVVLMTDGRRNLGPQGPEVARNLRNRGVPHVVVVPIGDPSPTRSLKMLRFDVPEKVFRADPFRARVAVEARGHEAGEYRVRLLRAPANGDGAPTEIADRTVSIDPASAEQVLEFEGLKIDVAGAFTLSAEITPPAAEPFVADRHVLRTRVEALAERTRVLLVAGGPSHEYRILRNQLIRDDTIEVGCWLESADQGFPQDGNVSLERLPDGPEELDSWDVFLFLDPDPARLPRTFWEQVRDQVAERGAGLFWVCGEKFTLAALRPDADSEPVASILPIEPDLDAAEDLALARGMVRAYPYEVTAAGRVHSVTRIAEDRAASAELWARLPGFHFAFPVLRAAPGAEVLVEHHKPARAGAEASASPLLVTRFFGAGRVLFLGTDDLYRWRSIRESAYDSLWVRGIRYLFEGRLNAGNSRLRLGVDESRLELGQAVRVVAEARDETFGPLVADSLEVRVRGPEGGDEAFILAAVEGAPGRFEAWLRPGSTGFHRVEATDSPEGRPAGASFEVVPAALEKEGPIDLAELAAIAGAPGGVLVGDPADFLGAVEAIPSATRIETFTTARTLWDGWVTIVLILTLLAAEWWIRKRVNLL
jgi:hypothetical protein